MIFQISQVKRDFVCAILDGFYLFFESKKQLFKNLSYFYTVNISKIHQNIFHTVYYHCFRPSILVLK